MAAERAINKDLVLPIYHSTTTSTLSADKVCGPWNGLVLLFLHNTVRTIEFSRQGKHT